LKKYNIPIVYTAHDLKMICPNYKMLASGEVCEACRGERYYNCLKNKCVRDSYSNSLLNAAEAYTHKMLKSYDLIDKIITPSDFYRKKFIEFGVDKGRMEYIPNFLDGSRYVFQQGHGDFFTYFGRLSEEKGIETLLRAMKKVKGKLKVVGTGPLGEILKEYTGREGLGAKVEYLGFKSGDELKNIIRNSMFIIVPSEWYENCPYSVLEAMASGKAVVGSDMGGIPELVSDSETGLIFESGSAGDLADKINLLLDNPELTAAFGENARRKFEISFSKEQHYKKILDIYKELIESR